MTKKHLKIGGSTAARTLNCPGWVKLSEQVPKPKPTTYADEGNLLHDCMEDYYMRDIEFEDMLGRKYNDQVLTEKLLPLLYSARNSVERYFDFLKIDEFVCEPFLEIYKDLAGGSVDVIGLSADKKTVLVLDYKFGAQPVNAEDNKQLKFYALAAKIDEKTQWLWTKARNIFYCIVQPKTNNNLNHDQGSISELGHFKTQLDEAIANPDEFNPGPHCDWCPCIKICPKKQIKIPDNLQKLVAKNI